MASVKLITQFAAAFLVLTLFSGCAVSINNSVVDQPDGISEDEWQGQLSDLLEVARSRGAGQAQIAVLESGVVDFSAYERAVRGTIDCLRAFGIEVVKDYVVETRGFPEIDYGYSPSSPNRTDDESGVIAWACILEHSLFVESAYHQSPKVQAALDQRFEPYRTIVEECLVNGGVQVTPGSRRSVLESLAVEHLLDSGVDCLAEVSPPA